LSPLTIVAKHNFNTCYYSTITEVCENIYISISIESAGRYTARRTGTREGLECANYGNATHENTTNGRQHDPELFGAATLGPITERDAGHTLSKLIRRLLGCRRGYFYVDHGPRDAIIFGGEGISKTFNICPACGSADRLSKDVVKNGRRF